MINLNAPRKQLPIYGCALFLSLLSWMESRRTQPEKPDVRMVFQR